MDNVHNHTDLCKRSDHERMVSGITALEVQWTGLSYSLKTDGDSLKKDNLNRYCTVKTVD